MHRRNLKQQYLIIKRLKLRRSFTRLARKIMFFAIVLIAVGLAILLNTLGIVSGTFWGFFWAIFFLAIGFKMMMKNGKCPMCGWGMWKGKMHNNIHDKMQGDCCDDECRGDECCKKEGHQ